MTRPALTARPGIALMLVLWIIVALGAISTGTALATRSMNAAAVNYRARVVARYAAESGVTAAVAAVDAGLRTQTESAARRAFLNELERAPGINAETELGDASFAVTVIDAGARLDVNTAGRASLATLFAYFTDAIEADRAAAAIEAWIAGGALAGGPRQAARPLRSLDDLSRVPGVPRTLARRAAPFLTVDGDGTINRATASDTVLAAAAGQLGDEPTRLIVVSRGWLHGQPLTHEIQAVYAVSGTALTLVRWRERDL